MKNNKNYYVIFAVIFLGLILGILINKLTPDNSKSAKKDNLVTENKEWKNVANAPSNYPSLIPSPTITKIGTFIISKDENAIKIEDSANKNIEYTILKSSVDTKYYVRLDNKLVPYTYEELVVGNKVTVELHPELKLSYVILEK
jgi:hypothetical protein